MDVQKLLNEIEELLEMDESTLTGKEALDGLEDWDSLAVIGFIATIDENYSIQVKPKELEACLSIEDLVSLVKSKL